MLIRYYSFEQKIQFACNPFQSFSLCSPLIIEVIVVTIIMNGNKSLPKNFVSVT